MVAIIKTSSAIRRPLHYNENKLKNGDTLFLYAMNYPGNSADNSVEIRMKYLIKMVGLNSRTKVNAVHISLNFSPKEKLERDRLIQISKEYMKGIGFENQPYLVYQHTDAGHPHLHIVTTNIQLDGKRIPLHNIGKLKSEPTRKSIEKKFGLVRAEDQKSSIYLAKRVDLSRIEYGKSETKRAIGKVLQHVLNNYHYTSLPELNAVLKGYNVMVDRGGEGSRIYKNRGLVFRVLDEKGEKVGVPIKSSLFHFKATLPAIESRFEGHSIARKQHLSALKSAIDLTLFKSPNLDLEDLICRLDRQGIVVVKRENQEGRIYGLTYVDHRSRCVFNGSSLGKDYSAKGILARLGLEQNQMNQVEYSRTTLDNRKENARTSEQKIVFGPIGKNGDSSNPDNLLLSVLKPEESFSNVPFEWRKRRKRRKKRVSNS